MVRTLTSGLLATLAVVSFTFMLPFQVAQADMIPSAPVSAPEPAAADSTQTAVVTHMAALGLSQEEITARVSEMTPADMETLAANPDQMNVAGSAWAIIAIAVGVAALIAILVLDSMRAKEHEQYRSY